MAFILVVDDELQLRNMLRRILEQVGHEVADASNGIEALQIYRARPADLMVLDLIMPGKEGLETISELRRDFPEAKIIAISGGGRIGPQTYLHMAAKLGAKRTFTKPFEKAEFLRAVEELLSCT